MRDQRKYFSPHEAKMLAADAMGWIAALRESRSPADLKANYARVMELAKSRHACAKIREHFGIVYAEVGQQFTDDRASMSSTSRRMTGERDE